MIQKTKNEGNSAMHRFHSMLISWAAVSDCERRVVEVPPSFWPKILTSKGCFWDIVSCELRKSDFWVVIKGTIRHQPRQRQALTVRLCFRLLLLQIFCDLFAWSVTALSLQKTALPILHFGDGLWRILSPFIYDCQNEIEPTKYE